jgi:hypothetical protein
VFVITNRAVNAENDGIGAFGQRTNVAGPNELRFARVQRDGERWAVQFLADHLDAAEADTLIKQHQLPLSGEGRYPASLGVACDLAGRARGAGHHVLFYVHGYNNDMADVLASAERLEQLYGVEVLAFSRPANGGGLRGKAGYLSDKRDARASAGALERTLEKLRYYLSLITASEHERLREQAYERHPHNGEKRDALLAELLQKQCPFTLNALYHSMGVYLLKQLLKSSANQGNELVFDNVVLCQADTNADGHASWVDQIAHNHRLFITLNENDYALRLSRMKPGGAQRARLGQRIKGLDSQRACYIDFTHADKIGRSHTPFGEPASANPAVRQFFQAAFRGEPAENDLSYQLDSGSYRV